jgi:hypothetical protein
MEHKTDYQKPRKQPRNCPVFGRQYDWERERNYYDQQGRISSTMPTSSTTKSNQWLASMMKATNKLSSPHEINDDAIIMQMINWSIQDHQN